MCDGIATATVIITFVAITTLSKRVIKTRGEEIRRNGGDSNRDRDG